MHIAPFCWSVGYACTSYVEAAAGCSRILTCSDLLQALSEDLSARPWRKATWGGDALGRVAVRDQISSLWQSTVTRRSCITLGGKPIR